jgi:Glycosyl hydrolase catalytic core
VIGVFTVLALAGSASASDRMAVGIFDDAVVFDPSGDAFPTLESLNVQVLRMMLVWGGNGGVANTRPASPKDPTDPAYDWSRYDRAIEGANGAGMDVLLTIVGTPPWANGGKGARHAPSIGRTLRDFAYAAARRYSGTFLDTASGRILPRVGMWLAWNEPNNPVFLQPQFTRVAGKWRMQAAADYARICNAVYQGVHAAGGPGRVACGGTAPRGYNDPTSSRPSISPLAFLRAAKKMGLRTFDAWAHHPYYGNARETPDTRNVGTGAVGLGNIDRLITEVTGLYGKKPVWITEYGYQTKPPDVYFGVSWEKQAEYLRRAYAIAKAHPRIDLFTWFLLRDSPSLESWQSGLITAGGEKKPAFAAFAGLRGDSL